MVAERTGVRSSAKVPDQSKMRLRIMRCRQLGYSLLGIEKKDSSGQGVVGVGEGRMFEGTWNKGLAKGRVF